MSSLLTNNSAMVALGTLRTINRDLGAAQNQISTGMRIANARDNAATWSIATTMRSDVTGFKAVSESLALGTATLGVGRDGAETVASLLDQLKGKVVAAQEANVDRSKIQRDVAELVDQIKVAVDATQFNGLNLLKGYRPLTVVASLNRIDSTTVTAGRIGYETRDLTTDAGAAGTDGAIAVPAPPSEVTATGGIAPVAAGTTMTLSLKARAVAAGDSYSLALDDGSNPAKTYTYVAAPGDTLNDVARGLQKLLSLDAPDDGGGAVGVTAAADPTTTDVALTLRSDTVAYTASTATQTGGTPSGGLLGLDKFDVSTAQGAQAALAALEDYIASAIGAAAEFGSAQASIDAADGFVGRILDSFTEGVGALVDADMEAASARLQALQVQQQLGTQALSIANQQPQNILALFQQ